MQVQDWVDSDFGLSQYTTVKRSLIDQAIIQLRDIKLLTNGLARLKPRCCSKMIHTEGTTRQLWTFAVLGWAKPLVMCLFGGWCSIVHGP